ncbi:MAG: class I SAM-dependent methyltransferase [Bacteroidia bacterium]
MNPDQSAGVNAAFTKQSRHFDELYESNPITSRMRNRIRGHVMKYLKPGMNMLELNAGTGLDAVFFAQQGIHVHATDISDGMVAEMQRKLVKFHLEEFLTIQQCSFTNLSGNIKNRFDYIFSNFGGLNCIPDLSEATSQFPELLNAGGKVTLVVMPKICPWEILSLLKGNFRQAFRRMKKDGTGSNIEGEHFTTWYFSADEIEKAMGSCFKLKSLIGLASLSPPPYKDQWAKQNPHLYKWLAGMDERAGSFFPFNHCADYLIATFELR